jgi:hypothetical protein
MPMARSTSTSIIERKVNQVIGRGGAQAALGGRYGLRGGVKRR